MPCSERPSWGVPDRVEFNPGYELEYSEFLSFLFVFSESSSITSSATSEC